MRKTIAESLKKLDVEMGRKMFKISKNLNIELPPSPLQGQILDYLFMNLDKKVTGKDLEDFFNHFQQRFKIKLMSIIAKVVHQCHS